MVLFQCYQQKQELYCQVQHCQSSTQILLSKYKSQSLYQKGMKPLISIHKKIGYKQWQRGCTNVQYYENQIRFQYGKKYYKTLSFQHTFLQQNVQTSFAHCYPYTLFDLKEKFKQWELSPKIKFRTLGLTCMKKPINVLQISKDENKQNKKAIVIMARQHPGETVGSLICDQMISNLLKPSQQNQFLLWRFTFYFIPIVNIDGVNFGNYRSNAYGFDLNRCWDKQNVNKLPQIYYIKKQIRKIQKKMQIQLLLDLHGHSRKMGSFFYGNPFGKHAGLLPYIAAKYNPNVSFEDSTFNKEKTQKLTTARVVLGNIIRDSGSFYTYETSFYGSNINGKKTHFTLQSFKDLALNLLSATYKTHVQIHKQEKTLKQSIFLKQIRKQVKKLTNSKEQISSCSDSEAAEITKKQMQAKQQKQQKNNLQMYQPVREEINPKHVSVQIQVDYDDNFNHFMPQSRQRINLSSKQIPRRTFRGYNKGVSSQKHCFHAIEDEGQEIENSAMRKKFLLQKLRIFGETFIEPNPKDKNKQTQTDHKGLAIMSYQKKLLDQSPIKINQYRKKKNLRNKSLILKLNDQKIGMADIVKINRLEYQRIRRNSKAQIKKGAKFSMLPVLN